MTDRGRRMTTTGKRLALGGVSGVISLAVIACLGVGWYWSVEPPVPTVRTMIAETAGPGERQDVVGYATTSALIYLTRQLLDKPGGYLTNDLTPPGVLLDDMPSWEYGVLVQVRDMSRDMRKDLARSQSTSAEDPDLAKSEPQFHFDNNSYWFPSTENEYRSGLKFLERYRHRLSTDSSSSAQFYARADNLRNWLSDVETRLGSLSQRLSASIGKDQINVDLAGDDAARRSSDAPENMRVKTPWLQIDNVFYEARGSAFAIIALMRAIEVDFHDVLVKKGALVSVQQIVRELEETQQPVYSPMILNGTGFGIVANHSLVMANYISRANAAIIDLRELLSRG
ncbi:Conserved hypothetical protein [gamma proteobacterium HdN1]|nr:Conserved hypothetical protein [gamma proteobacterium HdN1]